MCHFAATTTTVTAQQLATIFFKEIVRHHGVPLALISDRDTRFTSHFWQALWSMLGTKLKMSSSYHPQTDGQTERANRTLEQVLRAYVSEHLKDWDLHLVTAEFVANNSVQESTGFTPFYLNSGQDPLLPLSQAVSAAKQRKNVVPAASEMLKKMHEDLQLAQQSLKRAQDRQAVAANRYRREEKWEVGDEALLSTTNLTKHQHKLLSRFIGPFPVIEVINPAAVRLQLPREMGRQHNAFHVSKLKHFRSDSAAFPGREQEEIKRPGPVVVEDGDEPYYEVERILGKRLIGKGRRQRTQYLILWKGYPTAEAS